MWDSPSNELLVATTAQEHIDRLLTLFQQTFGSGFELQGAGAPTRSRTVRRPTSASAADRSRACRAPRARRPTCRRPPAAIDCERVSAAQVREVLALVPATLPCSSMIRGAGTRARTSRTWAALTRSQSMAASRAIVAGGTSDSPLADMLANGPPRWRSRSADRSRACRAPRARRPTCRRPRSRDWPPSTANASTPPRCARSSPWSRRRGSCCCKAASPSSRWSRSRSS